VSKTPMFLTRRLTLGGTIPPRVADAFDKPFIGDTIYLVMPAIPIDPILATGPRRRTVDGISRVSACPATGPVFIWQVRRPRREYGTAVA